jgi:hypothetical protein
MIGIDTLEDIFEEGRLGFEMVEAMAGTVYFRFSQMLLFLRSIRPA